MAVRVEASVKAKPSKWASEAAMLTAFAAVMREVGFRVVPESCGHDIILVAGPDIEAGLRKRHWTMTGIDPGDCIAVEGKLTNTITVLRQATPPHRRRWASLDAAAADFYLVVTPTRDDDFAEVANALGICCAVMVNAVDDGPYYSKPAKVTTFGVEESLRCFADSRVRPTHLNVAVTPGLPSPRLLTPWKLAAVRWCLDVGDGREFKAADVPRALNLRRFVDMGWAEKVRQDGRVSVYRMVDHARRPDREYPEIVAALAEESA